MTSSSAAAGVSAQTSDLFRLLLETVKDYAIFIISPEGYVLTWSPGAEALKGYKREEIVGQHFSKFYLPEAVESGLLAHAGVGARVAPTGPQKIGVGIAGMRERIRQFGGELTVSRMDPGTLVEAKIPVLPTTESV
jgi:PAS domain-containing protein